MNTSIFKILALGSIFIFTKVANAQSSVLASGGNGTASSGSISYSIGQVDYFNFSNSTNAINLGVQQPREFFTVGVNNLSQNIINLKVYPNPTVKNSQITLSGDINKTYEYQLFDISGKLIYSNNLIEGENIIPMENLAAAIYFLKVNSQSALIQTFKIVKN